MSGFSPLNSPTGSGRRQKAAHCAFHHCGPDTEHCTDTIRTASDSRHEKVEDDAWKWTKWVLFLFLKNERENASGDSACHIARTQVKLMLKKCNDLRCDLTDEKNTFAHSKKTCVTSSVEVTKHKKKMTTVCRTSSSWDVIWQKRLAAWLKLPLTSMTRDFILTWAFGLEKTSCFSLKPKIKKKFGI